MLRLKRNLLVATGLLLSCISVTAIGETTAYVGATLIDGTGEPPISDSVVVVRDSQFVAAGTRAQVSIPEGTIVEDRALALVNYL